MSSPPWGVQKNNRFLMGGVGWVWHCKALRGHAMVRVCPAMYDWATLWPIVDDLVIGTTVGSVLITDGLLR